MPERETVCRSCGVPILVTNAPENVELLLRCPDCLERPSQEPAEALAQQILTKLDGLPVAKALRVITELLEEAGVPQPYEPQALSEVLERDVSELMEQWDVPDLVGDDEMNYYDEVINIVHKHWRVRDDIWKEELVRLWAEYEKQGDAPPWLGEFCQNIMQKVAETADD